MGNACMKADKAKDSSEVQNKPRKQQRTTLETKPQTSSATRQSLLKDGSTVNRQLEEQGIDLITLTEAAVDGVWQQCT